MSGPRICRMLVKREDTDMEKTMEKIVALAKNRGFVYPGSEIYGGLANTWDYGNLGVELKNNVKKAWWQKFVQESPYNVGVDCAILMNSQTWVASGHLGGFSDPLMDCKECHERFRADKLIEDFCEENGIAIEGSVDGWSQEEMKKFIEEGRWHIAGSSWEASDVLVPSVEASIRNIMLGQTYYRQEFGKEGTDIFLPDCFGFGWTLPTIAAHCGLIGFSSQKLDWRNHPFYGKSKHPFTIGLWKGIDGKQVMLAHGYDYGRKWNNEDLSKNKDLEKLAQRTPLNTVYRYYGTGDIGGSPTLGSVRSVEQGIKGDGPVEVISATSDQLFKDYLPFNNHPELPVFDGELLMDVHGTGCYSHEAVQPTKRTVGRCSRKSGGRCRMAGYRQLSATHADGGMETFHLPSIP